MSFVVVSPPNISSKERPISFPQYLQRVTIFVSPCPFGHCLLRSFGLNIFRLYVKITAIPQHLNTSNEKEVAMQIVLEQPARVVQNGGSVYVLLPEAFFKYLDIQKDELEATTKDVVLAMGLGKHGKFLFLYSPKQQKRWQREQREREMGG